MLKRIALFAIGLFGVSAMANAQGLPIDQMQCKGTYGQLAYEGVVLADLWQYAASANLGAAGERRQLGYYLRQGEMHKIPGTVRLFAEMIDNSRNLVNFEVFLTQGTQGTGSVWVNGMRHRETFMTLVVQPNGFIIYPETGGGAQFICE